MLKLKKEYLRLIKSDRDFHYALCKATGKSWSTISRWSYRNDQRLTMEAVQNAIRTHLKLGDDMILTEPVKSKADVN